MLKDGSDMRDIWSMVVNNAVFLKVGAILFGSGYVLIAYLEGELVEKLG